VAAVLVGALGVCPATAQTERTGALGAVPLPGGLPEAIAAAGDPASPDRSQFLVDLIRHTYAAPVVDPSELRPLLAFLDSLAGVSKGPGGAPTPAVDTLPLPLSASTWIDKVFAGNASTGTLVSSILRSRDASLLYVGLLSLDNATRAWLDEQRDLVAEIASRHAAPFLLAAPALRVVNGVVATPGGTELAGAWEALAGASVREPAAFVRALLTREEGHLAYFFGSLAPLTQPQVRFMFSLDTPGERDVIAEAHRLFHVFARKASSWDIHQRPFWRPAFDPALLAADLPTDREGRPMLPGDRHFWNAAFDEGFQGDERGGSGDADRGVQVEFSWLCERLFDTEFSARPRRYHAVLFASRLASRPSDRDQASLLTAVNAAVRYPALTAALERGGVRNPAVFAAAAERAGQLSKIGDTRRAARAITQFQGTVALLTRAATCGSIPADTLEALVSSLSSLVPDAGDYAGTFLQWLDKNLPGRSGATIEEDLLRIISGPPSTRVVEWEHTIYRVDLAYAESLRVSRLLGDDPPPYFSAAMRLAAIPEALPALQGKEHVRHMLDELEAIAKSVGLDQPAAWPDDGRVQYDTLRSGLEHAGDSGGKAVPKHLARSARVLADDLLARGLLEYTYAVAMGQPERAWITAGDVARRHDLGLHTINTRSPVWDLPVLAGGFRPGFAVVGSLLGLDLTFADMSLVRMSSKPPRRKPMLADVNRRAFIETVPLVAPAALTDGERDLVVAAIERGRARVAQLKTPEDVDAVAGSIALGSRRASLLAWVVRHDPSHAVSFLAPAELLALGLAGDDVDETALHTWGAPADARVGCLCLRLTMRQPWDLVAGRWGSGILVSAFPDLNLRLAELLAGMHMPAALLGPVLASAMLDFVNSATSRDEDDRRGLLEFVAGLDDERLERYLALLTSGGPLVPQEEGDAPKRTVTTEVLQ